MNINYNPKADAQATIFGVVQGLMGHEHLKIFTCNLNIAILASTNPGFEVTITGGRLRNSDKNVLGSGMETLFQA